MSGNWQTIETLSLKRNPLGAEVCLVKIDEITQVVKNFHTKFILLKPLARYLAKRESQILQEAQKLGMVPKYYGMVTPYAFAMEYIKGYHLRYSVDRLEQRSFDLALQFLEKFHAKGMVYNDLRGRNIIVSADDNVHFIDFGAALVTSCGSGKIGTHDSLWCRLVRLLQQADRYHLLRLKLRFSQCGLTQQEQKFLKRSRPFKRITQTWKMLFRWRKRGDRPQVAP